VSSQAIARHFVRDSARAIASIRPPYRKLIDPDDGFYRLAPSQAGGILLHARKKRPPEKLCPRGAKDTTLFRERLDAPRSSPPVFLHRRILRRASVNISEAGRLHPCEQANASRSAESPSSREIPGADPIHVDSSLSEAARIGHFPISVKADFREMNQESEGIANSYA